MRICIHRGTREIGGTCIEIESQGQRIVLDVGLPLDVADADAMPLHPVPGFDKPDPSLLGVIISHPHQDHYGLAYRLPKETTFLIGRAARDILAAADAFTPSGVVLQNTVDLVHRQPIRLGPFTVTPYLVDHSAYDSYAVLVEADGQRLFYTGDFRAHGRKGKLVEQLIADPPKDVDLLLMEGTNVGRADGHHFPSEEDLVPRFVELFKATHGMALVWASGQNIDRLVTLYKACARAHRLFIIDLYTAHVLRATGNERIPQAHWDNIRVFLPWGQKRRIVRDQTFELATVFRPYRIFEEELPAVAHRSTMLFRPGMIQDMERMDGLKLGRLIHSMWSGYLNDVSQKPLLDWLRRRGIPLDECHTSGHASAADLVKLRKSFENAPLTPIHTGQPDRFEEVFGNVRSQADGEWWEVTAAKGPGATEI